ncbi:hypothetical protein VNO78_31008 [Psophocarpus tetragonolobus]|uniref:Uncharacterized protein n=1 Tax=Psophocarpus tetragonolobus TaxID=3891 RepID=A0AAN9RYG5_PSOTE
MDDRSIIDILVMMIHSRTGFTWFGIPWKSLGNIPGHDVPRDGCLLSPIGGEYASIARLYLMASPLAPLIRWFPSSHIVTIGIFYSVIAKEIRESWYHLVLEDRSEDEGSIQSP